MKVFSLIFLATAALAGPVAFHFPSSNTKFAASIYREAAADTGGNLLMSPLSAQLVLALSQAGAKDETASEIQKVLKLPLDKQLIDCVVVNLLQTLKENRDFVFTVVNKIYVKKGKPLNEDFATIAREVYDAEAEEVDFAKSEEAAEVINRWVEDKTNNSIHDLIDAAILSNKTRAVLVNALRFRGNWTVPFEFFSTQKQQFHTFGRTVDVDMMHISEERLQYYEKPGLKATFLELPITGGNASMTIVLPDDEDGLGALQERIDQVLEAPAVRREEVFDVALPKFRIESRVDLKKVLQNLGVKRAFEEEKADFSAMAGAKGDLFIDDVVQKTVIDVNEDGLEAAAATYVVKIANRFRETQREFRVDRPFLFFVKVDDVVVFVGRVIVPYY